MKKKTKTTYLIKSSKDAKCVITGKLDLIRFNKTQSKTVQK